MTRHVAHAGTRLIDPRDTDISDEMRNISMRITRYRTTEREHGVTLEPCGSLYYDSALPGALHHDDPHMFDRLVTRYGSALAKRQVLRGKTSVIIRMPIEEAFAMWHPHIRQRNRSRNPSLSTGYPQGLVTAIVTELHAARTSRPFHRVDIQKAVNKHYGGLFPRGIPRALIDDVYYQLKGFKKNTAMQRNPQQRNPPWTPAISYSQAHKWEPLAAQRGVSAVARSARGFMRAYQKARTFAKLPESWKRKREAFIARHMAQGKREQLWKDGVPSRRALALLMWAYKPRTNPRQPTQCNPGRSYLDKLVAEFGITDDPGIGFFILPNGSFLDGSAGSGMMRADDHRIIAGVIPQRVKKRIEDRGGYRYDMMVQVMRRAWLIRWMPESWSAELVTAPTWRQVDTLIELAYYAPLTIEVSAGARGKHMVKTFDSDDARRIEHDLRRLYQE